MLSFEFQFGSIVCMYMNGKARPWSQGYSTSSGVGLYLGYSLYTRYGRS
jgi:hypothetical protein